MKKRLEKLIHRRMKTLNESYEVARLVVLENEKKKKTGYRLTNRSSTNV